MNLATGITELKARGADYLSDARATIILNAARNDFEDFWWGWPWLETSTTGTAPVTISDVRQILYVTDTTGRTLLEGRDARDLVGDTDAVLTTTGTATSWYLDGSATLRVYPANTSTTFTVRYVKFSAELTGTDTPAIPTRHHPLWIDLAMVRVYRDSDDLAAAEALRRQTQEDLRRLVAVYELRSGSNNRRQIIREGALDW